MAVLATQSPTLAGLAPTFASAAGGGDKFIPGDHVYLGFQNTDSADHTVTIDSKTPSNYGTDEDIGPITIDHTIASRFTWIGPLPAQRFAGSDGYGDISYSAATGMKVCVVQF